MLVLYRYPGNDFCHLCLLKALIPYFPDERPVFPSVINENFLPFLNVAFRFNETAMAVNQVICIVEEPSQLHEAGGVIGKSAQRSFVRLCIDRQMPVHTQQVSIVPIFVFYFLPGL